MRPLRTALVVAGLASASAALAMGGGKVVNYRGGGEGRVTFDSRTHAKAGYVCKDCHADKIEMISKTPHAIIECENCHGPAGTPEGILHYDADKRAKLPIDRSREQCLRCHAKLAYPFTNVILCLLGVPIALRLRRVGRPLTFVCALSVGFLYLWLIEVGTALGGTGRLPPLLSAWMPNLVFAGAGLWMLKKAER